MDSLLYTLSETVHKQNYVIATYYTRLPREVDILKKAATLAVGQTIGTVSYTHLDVYKRQGVQRQPNCFTVSRKLSLEKFMYGETKCFQGRRYRLSRLE